MELPVGAAERDLEICKSVIYEMTGNQETQELAIKLLNLVYAKGGDYSEKTLQAFAKAFLES